MVPLMINPCIAGSQISWAEEKGSGDLPAAIRDGYITTKIKAKITLTEKNSDILFRLRQRQQQQQPYKLLFKDVVRRATKGSGSCSPEGLGSNNLIPNEKKGILPTFCLMNEIPVF